jgi:hypothetical protein
MFTEGTHDVNVNIGFYTQVLGLGKLPTDTSMKNFWSPNNSDTALCNFWRGVENINLGNESWAGNTMYAVSQAAPIRRVHVKGNLDLYSTASG